MELYKGRPENAEGRLPREIRTYDFLDELRIEYCRTDHEPADTMEACNRIDKVLGVVICKNLFLCNRQKTSFYLLMMPGDKKFKTKELSKQIGVSRLSFAEPGDMLKYLDIEPGAVSVMGLMNDKDHAVRLLIDEDLLEGDEIGCHPCVNTSSLRIKTKDITEKFLPATGHGYETVYLDGDEIEERIGKMEAILDRAEELLRYPENNRDAISSFQSEIRRLERYYRSRLWKDDFAADEAGKLPADLKRGVLSEDGIYDLLDRIKDLTK